MNRLMQVKAEILVHQEGLGWTGGTFNLRRHNVTYTVTGFDDETSPQPWAIYVDITRS
jgi:hypothetical protein